LKEERKEEINLKGDEDEGVHTLPHVDVACRRRERKV
jgi:hypothetical protein